MKEKISIIVPNWEFGNSGGSRVKSKLANEFVKNGCKVLFLCYYKSNEPYYPVNCEIEYVNEKGERVERENEEKPTNLISSIINIRKRQKALLKAMNRLSNDYNVAIANMAMTAESVSKSNIRNKYYYIQAYEAWEDGNNSLKKLFRNELVKRTYKLPLLRIVNAEIYKNYKEIHSDYVVPPGLDLSVYYPKTKYWDKERTIIVGCIGRLEEWKGANDVGRAIDMLHTKGFPVELKAAFYPVECKNYELVHPDGDENLAEFYRSVDILVAPAKLQLGAIHYPVIEAMACGVPLITTGYYPANEENSYLVPIASPSKIADTIVEISKNYDLAMNKAQISLKEIQRFDWNEVGKSMLDIISHTGNFE